MGSLILLERALRSIPPRNLTLKGTPHARDNSLSIESRNLPKSEHLELITVPDIVTPGAYSEAVQSVSVIIPMASPYTFSVNSNEELLHVPAREDILNILRSTAKA
jgi:hypothetical protein